MQMRNKPPPSFPPCLIIWFWVTGMYGCRHSSARKGGGDAENIQTQEGIEKRKRKREEVSCSNVNSSSGRAKTRKLNYIEVAV